MKILLLIDSLGAGGAQRQLVGLASMLKNSGYEVSVLSYFDFSFYKPYLEEKGIENICVKEASSHIKRIPLINNAIDKNKPDVVISYLETSSVITSFLKLLGKRWKLIVSERNTSQQNSKHEKIRFTLFRAADSIVPNSYSQQNFITTNYPKLSRKVKTITNFVDLDFFQRKGNHSLNEIKQIMVAASIWPPKNTLNFIKAVKILAEMNLKFHIKWFGLSKDETKYERQCKELINDLKLDDYIELLDKTSYIKDRYLESDFFCLPSYFEGTPNVICEAISCSLPVLCSDVCDNSIYVCDRANGFLFNPNSPVDMADKIFAAINLPQSIYDEYSRKSRKTAEKLLSKERFLKQYLQLIES